MTTTFITLALAILLGDGPARSETPRKPNPFAPSLPLLTEEEEEKLDDIIDRFIQYDIGRLRGEKGQRALAEFLKLGPEAIPALIRGMNRAANIEASCPAVTIARKLKTMLMASKDPELLLFARENIGAGVTEKRHMGVLKDLRVTCMLRKRTLDQQGTTLQANPGKPVELQSVQPAKALRYFTVEELVEAAGTERGLRQKEILMELAKRDGDGVAPGLASAATSDDRDIQSLARDLLSRYLTRQDEKTLKKKLKDDHREVRAAAARTVGAKGIHVEAELIALLGDQEKAVRQSARQALVKLHPGTDFGPKDSATETERTAAIRQWREWWSKRSD